MAIPGLLGKRVVHIACGTDYSAAVTDDGELYTWGCGAHGRLGHGKLFALQLFVDLSYIFFSIVLT